MEITKQNQPSGLGGWLILAGINIVFSIYLTTRTVVESYNSIMLSGIYTALTSPESSSYHSGFKFCFIFEITLNITFILLFIYLAYLFFTKNYKLPKVFIFIRIMCVVFIIVDIFITISVFDVSVIDQEVIKDLVGAIIQCMICIPYFRKSERVKNTFVQGKHKNFIADKNTVTE